MISLRPIIVLAHKEILPKPLPIHLQLSSLLAILYTLDELLLLSSQTRNSIICSISIIHGLSVLKTQLKKNESFWIQTAWYLQKWRYSTGVSSGSVTSASLLEFVVYILFANAQRGHNRFLRVFITMKWSSVGSVALGLPNLSIIA